jgi:hypothetical protein
MISDRSLVFSQENEMRNNRYLDAPSGYVVVGWIALLIAFFWLLFWGLNYIVEGMIWLANSI